MCLFAESMIRVFMVWAGASSKRNNTRPATLPSAEATPKRGATTVVEWGGEEFAL